MSGPVLIHMGSYWIRGGGNEPLFVQALGLRDAVEAFEAHVGLAAESSETASPPENVLISAALADAIAKSRGGSR